MRAINRLTQFLKCKRTLVATDHRKFVFYFAFCLMPSNKCTNKFDKNFLKIRMEIALLRRSMGLRVTEESGLQFIKFMFCRNMMSRNQNYHFIWILNHFQTLFFPFKFIFLCLRHFFFSWNFIASSHADFKKHDISLLLGAARFWVPKELLLKYRISQFTQRSLAVSWRKPPRISQEICWILPIFCNLIW